MNGKIHNRNEQCYADYHRRLSGEGRRPDYYHQPSRTGGCDDRDFQLAAKVAAGKATIGGKSTGTFATGLDNGQVHNWFEVLPGTTPKIPEQPKIEVFLNDDPVVA
jgi:hypothetical protein